MAAVGPDVGGGQVEAGLAAGLGLLGGPVHRLPGVLLDRVEDGRVDAAGGQDLTVGRQRVPGQPLSDLSVGAVLARIGAGMAAVPVGERLDERRAAAIPGPAERGQRHFVDRLHIVAVHHHRVEPVGGGAVGRGPGHGGHRADRRVLHVLVVLADEDHRQLPGGGQVERLVEGADVGGPVAEEADCDLPGAAVLSGPGRAVGDDQLRADDGVGAEDAAGGVEQVHRAALAVHEAVLPAEKLGHHRRHRGAAGQHVVVPAVGDEHVVVVVHGLRHARRDRLLAGAEVRGPLDQVLHEQVVGALFEQPDLGHLPVQLERGGFRNRGVHVRHVIALSPTGW